MAPDSKQTSASEELQYASGGLKRETGWWGAFVIGLAGTILVTGIAPVMVTALGAASIPITVFITLTGWLLCLFLAELAAMMPERTGGSPIVRLSGLSRTAGPGSPSTSTDSPPGPIGSAGSRWRRST